MSNKFSIFNFQFSILITAIVVLLFLLYPKPYTLNPTYAQTSACGTGTTNTRATGLVSTPSLTSGSKFGTTGACIVDPKATFAPFKIPTYADLQSIYFAQAKSKDTTIKHPTLTGDKTQGDIPLTGNSSHLYHVSGNLTILSNISGNQSGVIFVDGNLNIGPMPANQLTFGGNNSGLLFVVQGNVQIHQTITQVDAVIIAQGTICTAYDGTTCPSTNILTSQLIINGSLISLNESSPIKFRRTLTDNSQPAEKINHQIKYLVILRDLMSDMLQRWSEVP